MKTEERLVAAFPGPSRQTSPVKVLAVLGGILLAGELYLILRWASGPYFASVPTGPDVPPLWMRTTLRTGEGLSVLAALACGYWCLVRPWRRDRAVTVGGLLCPVALLTSLYDPISNYLGYWFTYNSYLANFGNYFRYVPGFNDWGDPGRQFAFPIVMIPATYVWFWLGVAALGASVLRRARRRWPDLGTGGLIAILFGSMLAFDLVFEGLIFMPLGFWEYSGGPVALLNSDRYFRFPLNELFFVGVMLTAFAALLAFRDDKGRRFFERGIDAIKAPRWQKEGLRFLALLAAMQVTLFATYHLPQSFIGARSSAWPEDTLRRSYLTTYVCGKETDRVCPGPAVPLRRPGSSYLGTDGRFVSPGNLEDHKTR